MYELGCKNCGHFCALFGDKDEAIAMSKVHALHQIHDATYTEVKVSPYMSKRGRTHIIRYGDVKKEE